MFLDIQNGCDNFNRLKMQALTGSRGGLPMARVIPMGLSLSPELMDGHPWKAWNPLGKKNKN